MSIGIYAFLRIYFLGFGVSDFAQFRTLSTPSSPAAVPICPALPVWYRVQTGAACPVSGRVCRCAACCGRSALHLARLALLPVVCSLSGCAGGRGTPAGYTATAQPRPVSLPTTEKIKKTTPSSQNETSVIVQYSKFSEKYKKAPLPV